MAYSNFLFDQICPGYIKEHSLKVSAKSDLIYGHERKGNMASQAKWRIIAKLYPCVRITAKI